MNKCAFKFFPFSYWVRLFASINKSSRNHSELRAQRGYGLIWANFSSEYGCFVAWTYNLLFNIIARAIHIHFVTNTFCRIEWVNKLRFIKQALEIDVME